MKRFCSLSVAVLTAAVLSACGGGGSTDAGSTTSYATQAAWTNLYSAGSHAWALSGTATYQPASGGSGSYPTTATLSLAAGADAPFPANSVPAYVLRSTSVTTVSGYPSESSTNDWYLDANYRYMGAVDGDGYCEVATQSALPPPTPRSEATARWLPSSFMTAAAPVRPCSGPVACNGAWNWREVKPTSVCSTKVVTQGAPATRRRTA